MTFKDHRGVAWGLGAIVLLPALGWAVPRDIAIEPPGAGSPETIELAPETMRGGAGIYESEGVRLLSQIGLDEFSHAPPGGNDIWGYVSPSGREYAIMGLNNETAFIEITDPETPVIVFEFPHRVTTWSDIAVYQDHAYVVTDDFGDGIQIFDMSRIDEGVVTHTGNYTAIGRLWTAHNIAINESTGFAYVVGSGEMAASGLVVVDVRDPEALQLSAQWPDRALHDVVVVSYEEGPYAGREVAFAAAQGMGVAILDVTDKENIEPLALDVTYPGLSYCHQMWPGENRRYLFVNDELDELGGVPSTRTYVFDITSLESPAYVDFFTNGVTATDHNLMVRGDYVYEANYRSGLRVYDVSLLDQGVEHVVEIGFFDTYPGIDRPGFEGAWGVFTGYPSGVVVVSDRARGLFVLDPVVTRTRAFTDVTPELMADPAESWGVAWIDIEGDGDPDLYLTNLDAPNRLFLNDGAGEFEEAFLPLLEGPSETTSAVWGDVDRDGDLDVYMTTRSGPNKLYRHDGGDGLSIRFTDITEGALGEIGRCRAAAMADYDDDGDLDLYVGKEGLSNRFFRNDTGEEFAGSEVVFVEVAAELGVAGGNDVSFGVSWVDYDNDGDPDLCAANYRENRLYRNDGGTFSEVPVNDPAWSALSSSMTWADYDRDGDLDVYVANWYRKDGLLRNDGDDTFVDVTDLMGLGATESNTLASAWGDIDRDTRLDLIIADEGVGLRLFMNQGETFEELTGSNFLGSGEPQGIALADYDGDGDPDIYATNAAGGNHLYQNLTSPEPRWLGVELNPSVSPPGGVGARVEVETAGVTLIREITAGVGYASQEPMMALFGVGGVATVEMVRVRWPSGRLTELADVTANQRLQLDEDNATPIDDTGPEGSPPATVVRGYRLRAAAPNPFNPRTRIGYDLPVSSTVRLTVFDLGGREVRRLVNRDQQPAGHHHVVWDGRDAQDRPVASGTYFYRLETRNFKATRRMALIR